MRLKRIIIIFAALFLFVGSFSVALAYPSSKNINVPNVQQEKSYWCWAASSVSALGANGVTITQSNFALTVKGSTLNIPANAAEVESGLSNYGMSFSYCIGGLSFNDIIYQMYTKQKPAIVGRVLPTSNHMVVLTGYEFDSASQYVIYMDPYYGYQRTEGYSSFYNTMNETIYNIH